ncbi:MAG: FtsW/RodA/SpoVE family cell cycle protein [Clostridia bacterium]|nr:FtsW/RodA/SpoVE family cell cycle protein [Clostridia bacterium]
MYGVRGANGVIIVNTKSGKTGKPKFDVRYTEGITQFTQLPSFAIYIRILHIGFRSGSKLGLVICTGIFSMLASQTIINVGMCLWLIPVIGVTLPLFSAGGTSLLCTYLGLAVVMSIKMHSDESSTYFHRLKLA